MVRGVCNDRSSGRPVFMGENEGVRARCTRRIESFLWVTRKKLSIYLRALSASFLAMVGKETSRIRAACVLLPSVFSKMCSR